MLKLEEVERFHKDVVQVWSDRGCAMSAVFEYQGCPRRHRESLLEQANGYFGNDLTPGGPTRMYWYRFLLPADDVMRAFGIAAARVETAGIPYGDFVFPSAHHAAWAIGEFETAVFNNAVFDLPRISAYEMNWAELDSLADVMRSGLPRQFEAMGFHAVISQALETEFFQAWVDLGGRESKVKADQTGPKTGCLVPSEQQREFVLELEKRRLRDPNVKATALAKELYGKDSDTFLRLLRNFWSAREGNWKPGVKLD